MTFSTASRLTKRHVHSLRGFGDKNLTDPLDWSGQRLYINVNNRSIIISAQLCVYNLSMLDILHSSHHHLVRDLPMLDTSTPYI